MLRFFFRENSAATLEKGEIALKNDLVKVKFFVYFPKTPKKSVTNHPFLDYIYRKNELYE